MTPLGHFKGLLYLGVKGVGQIAPLGLFGAELIAYIELFTTIFPLYIYHIKY